MPCDCFSSTMRKVLQSDAESTPVLSGKYWSTDRTVLALLQCTEFS